MLRPRTPPPGLAHPPRAGPGVSQSPECCTEPEGRVVVGARARPPPHASDRTARLGRGGGGLRTKTWSPVSRACVPLWGCRKSSPLESGAPGGKTAAVAAVDAAVPAPPGPLVLSLRTRAFREAPDGPGRAGGGGRAARGACGRQPRSGSHQRPGAALLRSCFHQTRF